MEEDGPPPHSRLQSVLEYLRDNFALVMRLAGTSSVKDISKDYLVQGDEV